MVCWKMWNGMLYDIFSPFKLSGNNGLRIVLIQRVFHVLDVKVFLYKTAILMIQVYEISRTILRSNEIVVAYS